MPLLKEQPQKIIDELAKLSDDHRRVFFGNIMRFENWLSKKIDDSVSTSLIIIL